MPRSIHRIATLTLVAPLAGAMLLGAAPATAATTTTAAAPAQATIVKADDPFSVFQVKVKAPAKVRAGGKITYSITAKNTGPHQADYYFLGGKLPKGTVDRLYYGGIKGAECAWDDSGFWCWSPKVLEVGDSARLNIQVKLKKTTKGTATARLGVIAYDVPTGAENLSKEELDRIGGVQGWLFDKKVKTKIVR
jgi:uncharacterized repeat protein (TIGR01451 family)